MKISQKRKLIIIIATTTKLISTEDSVDASIQRLDEYTIKSKERLITASSISNSELRPSRKTIKLVNKNGEKKQLFGQFKRQNDEIAHKKTWK